MNFLKAHNFEENYQLKVKKEHVEHYANRGSAMEGEISIFTLAGANKFSKLTPLHE